MIGLTVDVYRGRIAVPKFFDYALFVSFFPQLIAGPIMRGRELLPQLVAGGVLTSERTRSGLWLIASGLVKKVIFAEAPYDKEFIVTVKDKYGTKKKFTFTAFEPA